jgi:predicted transcriptional regulator
MRTKHTFRLPADLMTKLAEYAARKGVTQSLVLEAALASYVSPDGADRLEAALARRLDRLSRQMERIERYVGISNEALAVFVRFWLTSTPPLPDNALAAAQVKGRERYNGFVEALGRRLARGHKLAEEVSRDVDAVAPESEAELGSGHFEFLLASQRGRRTTDRAIPAPDIQRHELATPLRPFPVIPFFSKLPPCLIGMEACGTSHHWARELTGLGHEVRLMPPAYVKPYVRRGKTDARDAEAVCEVVTRPTMRFVPIKSIEQQAALALHRTRDLLVRQRTQLVNMIPSLLAELGIDIPKDITHALAKYRGLRHVASLRGGAERSGRKRERRGSRQRRAVSIRGRILRLQKLGFRERQVGDRANAVAISGQCRTERRLRGRFQGLRCRVGREAGAKGVIRERDLAHGVFPHLR